MIAALAACACASGCAGVPQERGSAAPPKAAAAGKATEGALRIVEVLPPPGTLLKPRATFRIRFDRPIAAASLEDNSINCYYPDPRAELIGDPFRLTSAWAESSGELVAIQPPTLLVGREVRLVVRTSLRAADGSALPQAPELPEGLAALFSYRVLELPPP